MTNQNSPELIRKRNGFIKNLTMEPIENDQFKAVFTQLTPRSGEVIFYDKIIEREAKAKWGTYFDQATVKATLADNHEMIIDTDIENYRVFIEDRIIILNLFSDRDRFTGSK